MKKYNINIGSTSNSISDDKFFLGTGFMGAEFSNIDELRSLLHKYATFEKDGKRYWREEIKMTFSLQSTVSSFKAEGDRQAKEKGIVNLFSCMAACAKDPFRKISIIYRPSRWIDEDGDEFAFILIKGDEVIPQKNKKLRDILREIGIEI